MEGTGNWGLKKVDDVWVCTESGDSSASFTWAGRCSGGIADGKGVVDNDGTTFSGTISNGKTVGHWVRHLPNGEVSEGTLVGGRRTGHWVIRFPDGIVGEGPMVDDEQSGRWHYTRPDGSTYELCWRAGETVDCN